MEIGTLVAGPAEVGRHSYKVRVSSVFAALALVLSMFVLVQPRADAAPVGATVAAAVALPAIGAVDAQTIDIRQIVCPILLAVRNAFATSPFFAIVVAALNPILIAFGCIVS